LSSKQTEQVRILLPLPKNMAPDLSNCTTVPTWRYTYTMRTRGPHEVFSWGHDRFESYEYDDTTSSATYWSHRDKYDTSYTQSLVYPTKQIEKNVKKLLKKMMDELAKEGWVQHVPYYLDPKVTSMSLRSVRLEGRGWGNKK
jgi:hypothetical protein